MCMRVSSILLAYTSIETDKSTLILDRGRKKVSIRRGIHLIHHTLVHDYRHLQPYVTSWHNHLHRNEETLLQARAHHSRSGHPTALLYPLTSHSPARLEASRSCKIQGHSRQEGNQPNTPRHARRRGRAHRVHRDLEITAANGGSVALAR